MKIIKMTLPSCFKCAVDMLQRPYYPISKQRYDKIMQELEEAKSDCFMYRRKVCTVGTADNGYAIMPLKDIYQS